MSAAAIIMTCYRHREMADMLSDALKRWAPHIEPIILDADDHSWESPLPDDVRKIINAGLSHYHICLRRVFDAPCVTDAETLYILDSDCFVLGPIDDWGPCAFMASWAGPDNPDRVAIWEALGYKIPNQYPCLCAGTCSYPRSLMLDNRDLCIEFVRMAVKMKYYRPLHPSPSLDNALIAGLWKLNFKLNILPSNRYCYQGTTDDMVLYHAGCGVQRLQAFTEFTEHYRKFLYEDGPKDVLCQFRPTASS